jgi:hypothetical protein
VHDASTGLVNEWLPIDVTEPWMDLVVVFGLLTVWAAVRRRWWSTAAVLLVLVVLGIAVRRFQPIMAVCAIPVLAAALDTRRPGSGRPAGGGCSSPAPPSSSSRT